MAEDKAQIGLTSEGSSLLSSLVERKLFNTEGDGYRFCVAYALAREKRITDAPDKGYQTKFNASGGLDRDGSLRDLVTVLLPDESRPYAAAERLAEMGIRELDARLTANESLSDILFELQPVSDET